MTKWLKVLCTAGLAAGTVMVSCMGAMAESTTEAGEEKTYKVGAIFQDLSNEWIVIEKDAFLEEAEKHPNIEFIVLDGQGDPANQIKQMETLVSQKCDLIICNPYDQFQLTPSIQGAIEGGIPVIALGTNCDEDVGQIHISSSNQVAGEMQMQQVVDDLGGKGNIAVLRGPNGNFSRNGRDEGWEKVLENYPDIHIVFDQAADWSRVLGMDTMENWLSTGTQIDALVGQNDEMALGAAVAIEAAGRQDEIRIYAIDGIPDALNAVKEGRMVSTLFQDAKKVGKEVVLLAEKMLNGEEVEKIYDVPFEMVTIDNVDEYFDR